MRPQRPVGLVLLLAALGSLERPALAGDSVAEARLKAKGLTREGRVFVIPDEKPALAKMKEARSSFESYAALAGKQAAFERFQDESGKMEERRAELKTGLDDLNQRILELATSSAVNGPARQGPGGGGGSPWGPSSPLIMQRDQVKVALEEVTSGLKSLKAEAPVVKDKAALDDDVKKRADAFKADLASLRATFDEVKKKYADLAADDSVKKPLEELAKAGLKLKLGPSDAFLAAAKELDQAERRYLGKKPAPAPKKKASKAKR